MTWQGSAARERLSASIGTPTTAMKRALVLDGQVGEGTHGIVYRSRDTSEGGELLAVKRLRPTRGSEGISITAYREINLLRELCHPNLVRLLDVVVTRESTDEAPARPNLNLVFEHVSGGDLAQRMADMRKQGDTFAPPVVARLFRQLASGLEYLHGRQILHRDIKPANLLVDAPPSWQLRIADFGLARQLTQAPLVPLTENVVTLWYRAPELLLGSRTHTPGVDLWAAGCVLFELLSADLQPLFPGREAPDGEPLQRAQLSMLLGLLGVPARAAFGALDDLRHWKALCRWPELRDLEKHDEGATRARLAARLDARRPTAEGGARGGEGAPDAAVALAASLLAYDPAQRPSAAAALASDFLAEAEQGI